MRYDDEKKCWAIYIVMDPIDKIIGKNNDVLGDLLGAHSSLSLQMRQHAKLDMSLLTRLHEIQTDIITLINKMGDLTDDITTENVKPSGNHSERMKEIEFSEEMLKFLDHIFYCISWQKHLNNPKLC